jgi:hypothetical protein
LEALKQNFQPSHHLKIFKNSGSVHMSLSTTISSASNRVSKLNFNALNVFMNAHLWTNILSKLTVEANLKKCRIVFFRRLLARKRENPRVLFQYRNVVGKQSFRIALSRTRSFLLIQCIFRTFCAHTVEYQWKLIFPVFSFSLSPVNLSLFCWPVLIMPQMREVIINYIYIFLGSSSLILPRLTHLLSCISLSPFFNDLCPSSLSLYLFLSSS